MCVSTGNRYLDIGLSVALGAATGGFSAPLTAAETASANIFQVLMSSAIGGAVVGLGTGLIGVALTPQQPTYEVPQQTPLAQQQNSQNIETTGSGGRQATASLADAIKRSKQRKLTQEDVGDLSIDTSSFANTGLQLA